MRNKMYKYILSNSGVLKLFISLTKSLYPWCIISNCPIIKLFHFLFLTFSHNSKITWLRIV